MTKKIKIPIFPKSNENGVIIARDGRSFKLTDPQDFVEKYNLDNIHAPVDIEHKSELIKAAANVGDYIAAVTDSVCLGYVTKLTADGFGGIFGDVELTDFGEYVTETKQFKYTSPSFFSNNGEVTKLTSVAFVKSPALKMPSLFNEQTDNINLACLSCQLEKNKDIIMDNEKLIKLEVELAALRAEKDKLSQDYESLAFEKKKSDFAAEIEKYGLNEQQKEACMNMCGKIEVVELASLLTTIRVPETQSLTNQVTANLASMQTQTISTSSLDELRSKFGLTKKEDK